jgi:hypothetical protein
LFVDVWEREEKEVLAKKKVIMTASENKIETMHTIRKEKNGSR